MLTFEVTLNYWTCSFSFTRSSSRFYRTTQISGSWSFGFGKYTDIDRHNETELIQCSAEESAAKCKKCVDYCKIESLLVESAFVLNLCLLTLFADPTESCVFAILMGILIVANTVFHCVFTNSKSFTVLYNIVTLSGKFNKLYKNPFKCFQSTVWLRQNNEIVMKKCLISKYIPKLSILIMFINPLDSIVKALLCRCLTASTANTMSKLRLSKAHKTGICLFITLYF